MGRSASTLSREVRRNRPPPGSDYQASTAQAQADAKASLARRPRKLLDPWLWNYVLRQLRKRWSPEQIAGSLVRDYPDDMAKRVSHETIYAALYVLPRGELRKELLTYLRQHRKNRRPRTRGVDRRGQIPNMVSIDDRPLEVASRQVPGHWEGDLIKGKGLAVVGTLVERKTMFLRLVKLPDARAETARKGFERKFIRVPEALRKTLTYDQGKEMAQHEILAARLKIQVFFAHPHSPWERGTCENTNGLLRQFLPKGMDFSKVTQVELNRIAHLMNTRPRKTLKWATPLETYQESLSVALEP
jgi:transposase, IS30 family